NPFFFLKVQATNTGNLPNIFTIALYMSSSESTFTEDGLKAVRALVRDAITPTGCADFGKASTILRTSSSTTDCALISAGNFSSSLLLGNSPQIRRRATSRKSALSASSSIEYPRYLKIPLSPSKNVMALRQDPVFL